MDGVLVIDKPAGCTSHDVVNRVRRVTGIRRIGHLGTLDPLATGVLPLLIGRATRLAQYFGHNDKKYDAVIRFGLSTDTYDREGTITATAADFRIERDELADVLGTYRGTFFQTPPPVSAKKVKGVPAYKLARKNIAVELEAVEVTVHSLELVEFSGDTARIKVHCSAGTYVRAIAHEVGQRFGCGAIIDDLRRTASGDFTEADAVELDQLDAAAVERALIPAAKLLPDIPSEIVDMITAGQIRQGRDFRVSPFRARGEVRLVKAISPEGELLAIGEARLPNVYHPVLVL